MSEIRRLHGIAAKFRRAMVKAGSQDLAASGDWTPATGDVKVSTDGGDVANVTTLPVAVGGAGSILWEFSLSTSEMSGAEIVVQVVDAAGDEVEDNTFVIETEGSSSAARRGATAGEGAAI